MTDKTTQVSKSNRLKFLIGGGLFLVAVIFMIISVTRATAEFFITVKELQDANADFGDQNLRISGAVIGDSISYDVARDELQFIIAHIPGDQDEIRDAGGLSTVLHRAVTDPNTPHQKILYRGAPPDMLRNEAQAILTGTISPEGVFMAEELLLKCPSKYEEAVPNQAEH